MAIAQTKASPVQTPARILSAGAPNGKVSATADCCPTVVRFVNLDFLFDNPNLRPLALQLHSSLRSESMRYHD